MNLFNKLAFGVLTRAISLPRNIPPRSFSSWDLCQEFCKRHGTATYLTGDLNNLIAAEQVYLSQKVKPSDASQYASMLGLVIGSSAAIQRGEKFRVLDFGGSAGLHYHDALALFGDIFEWVVVETDACTSACKKHNRNQPRFFGNITAAKDLLGAVDLCLVSGSIQYCPNPDVYLQQLSEINSAYYLLCRTPLIRADQVDIAGRWYCQSARYFHHLQSPKFNWATVFGKTAYPVTFLRDLDLESLDKGRRRILQYDTGPLYNVYGSGVVHGRTILWGKRHAENNQLE